MEIKNIGIGKLVIGKLVIGTNWLIGSYKCNHCPHCAYGCFHKEPFGHPIIKEARSSRKSPNDMALSFWQGMAGQARPGQGYSAVRNKTVVMIYLHAASNKTFPTLRRSKSVYKHDQRV